MQHKNTACLEFERPGTDPLLLIAVIYLFQGCGLVRNANREVKQGVSKERTNTMLTQVGSLVSSRKSEGLILRKDSADKVYTIQFWPKGRFSFSTEHGFVGEADKVIVNAYTKEGSVTSAQKHSEEASSAQWKDVLKQTQDKKDLEKQHIVKTSVSWKWILILALCVAVIIFIKVIDKIYINQNNYGKNSKWPFERH
jgi:hypothetical protein